ncbi:MAG: hypothetical protein WC073_08735 [Sterolibacterium sp.]
MFLRKSFPRTGWLAAALCAISCAAPAQAAETEITSSTVYSQALQIEKEIELLRRHYKITVHHLVAPVEADLQSRHTWQKAYMVMVKLALLRRKHGLAGFSPVSREPDLRVSPRVAWGQTLRVLTEIKIIKGYLGIPGEVSLATKVAGKRPVDVFNKLNQISYDIDALNGELIGPSEVYAEAMRINEDVSDILLKTGTPDTAFPPPANPNALPKDTLAAAFALMDEIQRLQRQLGLETVDFSAFRKQDKIVPEDGFNVIGMCLAESLFVKAKLGMKHVTTPAAEYREGKTHTEVVQLLGYVTSRLRSVKLH